MITHGGFGYSKEFHVERLLREIMIPVLAPVGQQHEVGAVLQQRMVARAREAGVAILGPNCVGAMNARTRLCATINSVGQVMTMQPGPFSFVSRSGAIGGYWLDKVLKAGVRFADAEGAGKRACQPALRVGASARSHGDAGNDGRLHGEGHPP